MRIELRQTTTKALGRSTHDVFNPVADSVGFWQKGEIKINDQIIFVEKEPNDIWREVGLSAPYKPHPDMCPCDQCAFDYYALTGEC